MGQAATLAVSPRPEEKNPRPSHRGRRQPAESTSARAASRGSPRPDVSLPVVLVADDDAPVRAFIHLALESAATVVEARDGEQALRILEHSGEQWLSLVLLDYKMPVRSGLEVLKEIRRRRPWLPVVIITGHGSEEVAVQALRAGARDYLRKPFTLDQLLRTVLLLTAHSSAKPRDPSTSNLPRPVHRGIVRAVTFAAAHSTEPITLSDIAAEASLSKFHFCRLFQREMGFSFREYLQGLRIRRAQVLLADPGLSITEVAYASGFNDLSHFDRVFHRIVGVSPRAYRKTAPRS